VTWWQPSPHTSYQRAHRSAGYPTTLSDHYQGFVWIRGHPGAWVVDTLFTRRAPQAVRIVAGPTPHTWDAVLLQGFFEPGPRFTSHWAALFVARHDSVWHEPVPLFADPLTTISVPNATRDGASIVLAWSWTVRGAPQKLSWATFTGGELEASREPQHVPPSFYRPESFHGTNTPLGASVAHYTMAELQNGRQVWIIRESTVTDSVRVLLQSPDGTHDLGRLFARDDDVRAVSVAVSPASIVYASTWMHPSATEQPGGTTVSSLALSCKSSK
jgi:hypothetical protein